MTTAAYHRLRAHDWLDRAKQFRASLTDWTCMADDDDLREWMYDALDMAHSHLNEARALEREARQLEQAA